MKSIKIPFIASGLAAALFISGVAVHNIQKRNARSENIEGSVLGAIRENEDSNPETAVPESIVFETKEVSYKKDKTTEVLIDAAAVSRNEIDHIVQHGDHWHVFTKDGREIITYTDPTKAGSIDELGSTVNVVSSEELKNISGNEVVKILRHGDHYHIYTADGREVLTYEDPSALYPGIPIGEYSGSHDKAPAGTVSEVKTLAQLKKEKETGKIDNKPSPNANTARVYKILVHGDHYHVYTTDGREWITYTDPRPLYPGASFGIYEGTHGDGKSSNKQKDNNQKAGDSQKPEDQNNGTVPADEAEKERLAKIAALKIIGVMESSGEVNRYDIVKILRHGDHYHIYDSKGNEGITYTDPRELYPKAVFGEYEGNHGGDKKPDKPQIKWPEGITKIVDHGDHWHLYRGDEEVAVVRENPRDRYPNAEYIVEKGDDNSNIEVTDDELFGYNDVEAKVVEGVITYLDDLKNMTHFGDIKDNLEVYGSNGKRENIFYWLHGNHYHAITIKQIIQNAKAGKYGSYTARDVVSTLKAKIENGEELIEEVDSMRVDAVKKYLRKYYGLDESDVEAIGNRITLYITNGSETKTLSFNAVKDFDITDGKAVPKKALPEINKTKPVNSNEENEDTKYEETGESPAAPDTDEAEKAEENPISSDLSEDEIAAKCMQIFSLTEDEFRDALSEIPDSSVKDISFNEDGTVSIKGTKYNLREIAGRIKGE